MNKDEIEKAEAERIALEKELLAKQQQLTKLTSRRMSLGEGSVHQSQSGSESHDKGESDVDLTKKKKKRGRNSPGSKATKKSRSDLLDSDEESCEELEDPLENIEGLVKKLKSWVVLPAHASKISKPQAEKFNKYIDKLMDEIVYAKEERARQETRVTERTEIGKIVREIVREEVVKIHSVREDNPASYAQAAKNVMPEIPPISGNKGPVMQPPKQVIVRHETKESDEVIKDLKRLVLPSRIGLKVRRLVSVRNGVIVEAETEEGAENLVAHAPLKEAGFKVERPTKKKPVMMIYDVGADLKDEEIKDEVFSRNLQGSSIERDEFMEEFRIRRKFKDLRSAGKKVNLVVESSVRVRNWLRGKERIFVEWQSCKVIDYVDLARCYKCQRYGHIAKHCDHEKPSCSHCAGEHEYKDCPDKDKKEKECCANCKREKRQNIKHNVASKKCAAYEKAIKRRNEKTDYGY